MRNFPRTYKDLVFWQKSFEVARLVFKLARKLPRSLEVKIILNQLFRSVMSVGANIAEGYGRYGKKEYPRFLQVALGSANETDYWLLLLCECLPTYKNEINEIVNKNTEVIKMLAKSVQTIKNKTK